MSNEILPKTVQLTTEARHSVSYEKTAITKIRPLAFLKGKIYLMLSAVFRGVCINSYYFVTLFNIKTIVLIATAKKMEHTTCRPQCHECLQLLGCRQSQTKQVLHLAS